MNRFEKLSYFSQYTLTRVLGGLLNLLPLSLALLLARPIGNFLFWILRRSRQTSLRNLRNVYGAEKSEAEIQKIARECFVYLSEFGAEWLRMPQIAKEPERYLAINRVDRIHSALKEGKGALLLVSHAGNWEIMALIAGLLIARPVGASIYALARPLKNPYLYEHILRLRGLTGLQSIPKIGAVRETFRRLKENAVVCLLIDQRVNEGSVETEFFGQEALTTSLPAICALRLGTPIFMVSLKRMPDLRYVMDIGGPLLIGETGDQEKDIQANTQRFNDWVEAEIRKNPAHWLWMHNRWRERHGAKD